MKQYAGCLFYIVYLGMGLLQLAAICGGIKIWLGWPGLLAGIAALFVAYIPIVGTVLGIFGAVKAWDWSWTAAILFFCWQWILFAIIFAGAGVSSIFGKNS